jgi:hypothetical protein
MRPQVIYTRSAFRMRPMLNNMTTIDDLRKLNAAFCEKPDWYKDGLFWRDMSGEWARRRYGFDSNGKGDVISNTMMKIIHHDDRSPEAYESLESCKQLLLNHRRWPRRMNHAHDSKNRIDLWWGKFLHWIKIRDYIPYRWSSGMTRDPYIFFYVACILLDREEWIREVKMPIYIWLPGVWAWRKTLYKRNWWNDFWYREKKSHKLFYVTRLREFRAYAYDNT